MSQNESTYAVACLDMKTSPERISTRGQAHPPYSANTTRREKLIDMHLMIQLNERDEFFEIAATTDRSQVATMTLQPGQASGEYGNDHEDSDQVLYVISGTGRAEVEDQEVDLNPGDSLLISAKERHRITGTGSVPLRTLNVYAPIAYPSDN